LLEGLEAMDAGLKLGIGSTAGALSVDGAQFLQQGFSTQFIHGSAEFCLPTLGR
jgi:hypothetical protein